MPPGAFFVAYADDVATVIQAQDFKAAQGILTEVMDRGWGEILTKFLSGH